MRPRGHATADEGRRLQACPILGGGRLLEAIEKIDGNGSEQTADHDQQPIRPLLALRIVVVAPAGLRVLNIVGLHCPTVAQAYVRSLCPSLLAPAAAQGQT